FSSRRRHTRSDRDWSSDVCSSDLDGEPGWAWWELKDSEAPRADLDALRLLAVFLAHWDNKAGNQRLVCLDPAPRVPDQPCAQPVDRKSVVEGKSGGGGGRGVCEEK